MRRIVFSCFYCIEALIYEFPMFYRYHDEMSTWSVLFLRVSSVMLKRWFLVCGMRTINSTFPPNILSCLHNYFNVLWTLFCSEVLTWQSPQSMKELNDV
jgi:hypothetical protein